MSRHNRDLSQSTSWREPPSLKRQQDSTKEVHILNNHLKTLRDTVLPRQPYEVSVPSDVPYRHSSRFVNTWYVGTPFEKDEEQLQYMSFLPHQETEESLLKVVGGWSDEQGNTLREEEGKEVSPATVPYSGHNTPGDKGRKKISLNQYKTKGKGETDTPVELVPSRNLAKQSGKMNAATTAVKNKQNIAKEELRAPAGDSKKRAREEELQDRMNGQMKESPIRQAPDIHTEDTDKSASPRPVKKAKLEPSPPSKQPEKPRKHETLQKASSISHEIPGLLSPTLPPKAEDSVIPALLSPTIPASIQEFLDAETSRAKVDGVSDRHRTDSVRSLIAAAGLGDADVGINAGTPALRGGDESRMRSDSQHSVRSTQSNGNGVSRVVALSRTPVRSGTPLQNGARASPGPRQRHTIMLKYGKRNRKRVEALLKFTPRPEKAEQRVAAPSTYGLSASSRKPPASDGIPSHKQRPRDRTPEIVSMPQKAPASLNLSDKPSTPIHAPPNSPALPEKPLRSTFTTPKKDLKSAAMRRVESSDGIDVRTPTGDQGRLSTPQPIDRSAAKFSPGPTSAPSARDEERTAWIELGGKYFALGRKIKTEGTQHAANAKAKANTQEAALSVVLMIEGLLCFMINMAANTYSRPNIDPGWRTIIPYLEYVLGMSKKTTHLNGLAVQLGAVCRQFVHKYDLERLARDPLPDDQCASAPTPGSDGNTKTNEDGEKYKKKHIEFRDQLVRNSKELQIAWLEGSKLLSPETLKEDFPVTWTRRATDSSLRGTERPRPSELGGRFYIPFDENTTTLEAVRFTVEVLQEWTEREHVNWTCRIEL